MSVAPARSSRRSRVISVCFASRVMAAPSAAGPGRWAAASCQQFRVQVVHYPMLGPGKEWRQPAAHLAGAAAEVVDHPTIG